MFKGTPWSYVTPEGGIDNSSIALLVKAADATRRHRVTSLQITHAALGSPVEFVLGIGGPPVFRVLLGTAAFPQSSVLFEEPLTGLVNEEVAIQVQGAVPGAVYVSLQGDSI